MTRHFSTAVNSTKRQITTNTTEVWGQIQKEWTSFKDWATEVTGLWEYPNFFTSLSVMALLREDELGKGVCSELRGLVRAPIASPLACLECKHWIQAVWVSPWRRLCNSLDNLCCFHFMTSGRRPWSWTLGCFVQSAWDKAYHPTVPKKCQLLWIRLTNLL